MTTTESNCARCHGTGKVGPYGAPCIFCLKPDPRRYPAHASLATVAEPVEQSPSETVGQPVLFK